MEDNENRVQRIQELLSKKTPAASAQPLGQSARASKGGVAVNAHGNVHISMAGAPQRVPFWSFQRLAGLYLVLFSGIYLIFRVIPVWIASEGAPMPSRVVQLGEVVSQQELLVMMISTVAMALIAAGLTRYRSKR